MRVGRYSSPRRYSVAETAEVAGRTYIVRDVVTRDMQFAGFCQFKTKRADGVVVWKPCREGVDFADIEPFNG